MESRREFPLKNGNTVIIRLATEADAAACADLSNACYRETRFLSRCSEDEPIKAEQKRLFFREIADSSKEAAFVAEYNGHIVGCGDVTACLNKLKMRHKCDAALSVLRAQWHLGIGSALMETLLDFACEAGYEQVNLNVADDNIRAIGLYERFGFQHTGTEVHAMKHADGDYSDFWLMTKFL